VAMRDAVLDLKQQLADRFAGEVSRLVTLHLRDDELLRRMILEVAGRAAQQAGVADEPEIEVLLPADAIGLAELRRRPEELHEGPLGRLVLGTVGELLREGVTFGRSADVEGGIEVRLEGRSIVLDLSDRAVAGVILEHLQPRFRALLEGVIG
jgi:V/A-type H+/Na+-transporting ATPase subunit E